MTIPGINIYIATGIIGEIGNIQRFRNKESLASYAGVVPKEYQSGRENGKDTLQRKERVNIVEYWTNA
jgi:transposase